MRRELIVRGGRDPGDVWDRYVRPARWAEWSPQIRSVEYAGECLAPGTAGVVRGLGGVLVPFEVLAVSSSDVRSRSWAWRARALGAALEFTHVVEPDAEGTVTRLLVAGPLPLVLPYLPLARLALLRLVSPSP